MGFSKLNITLAHNTCNTSKAAIDKKVLVYSQNHSKKETIIELTRLLNAWIKMKCYNTSKRLYSLLSQQKNI